LSVRMKGSSTQHLVPSSYDKALHEVQSQQNLGSRPCETGVLSTRPPGSARLAQVHEE